MRGLMLAGLVLWSCSGCGEKPVEKIVPKITPEDQAELDRQHEAIKAGKNPYGEKPAAPTAPSTAHGHSGR